MTNLTPLQTAALIVCIAPIVYTAIMLLLCAIQDYRSRKDPT